MGFKQWGIWNYIVNTADVCPLTSYVIFVKVLSRFRCKSCELANISIGRKKKKQKITIWINPQRHILFFNELQCMSRMLNMCKNYKFVLCLIIRKFFFFSFLPSGQSTLFHIHLTHLPIRDNLPASCLCPSPSSCAGLLPG